MFCCARNSWLVEVFDAFESVSSATFSTIGIYFDFRVGVVFLRCRAAPGLEDNGLFEAPWTFSSFKVLSLVVNNSPSACFGVGRDCFLRRRAAPDLNRAGPFEETSTRSSFRKYSISCTNLSSAWFEEATDAGSKVLSKSIAEVSFGLLVFGLGISSGLEEYASSFESAVKTSSFKIYWISFANWSSARLQCFRVNPSFSGGGSALRPDENFPFETS